MALTDTQVRNATAEDKDKWLSDANGLRLLVKRNGSKYWRLKYRFLGKQKTLAIGVYPEISLKEARQLTAQARNQIESGIDPSEHRKSEKISARENAGNLFSQITKDWWNHQKGTWKPDHANRVLLRLEQNAFPLIGNKPITEIRPQEIIKIARLTEDRGAPDVAQRVLQDIRRVFRYAVQHGLLETNPASELQGILKGRKTEHRASLPREELPLFLKALSEYQTKGRKLTQFAIELLILTFVRPGELRGAMWEEFDLEERVWRIPGERMKMGTDHIVPLSYQALIIIEEIRSISGAYPLLFPSERNRSQPMSDNTMRRAIFKLGYDGNEEGKSKANPHGFRATASSILNETGFNPDAIERQLSHMERNAVRGAYTHHAKYLDERKELMQWWADYLDSLKNPGVVVPIFSQQG
ncbi:tyrosine-type recombinase/integrase [Sessilibacter corallicola]|uniref:tyrosine-type recombinase/integrase n=1 Tax=Sessilibacter corallicola TaxID=2904075 RepID=UPI001E296DFA|nr:integrase arm-type DNA-binding domain-containing protein [Sessilibacter corallicola]MCE2028995.1 tyrosine-type recombinase/integrase [Sessilibacter corallicola]